MCYSQPIQSSHRTLPKIKLQQAHAVFLLLDTDRDGLLTVRRSQPPQGKLFLVKAPCPRSLIVLGVRTQGAEITHGGRLLGLQLSVIVNGDIEQAPPTVTFEQFCALVAEAMHRDHNCMFSHMSLCSYHSGDPPMLFYKHANT
jgi:hypothetical protein